MDPTEWMARFRLTHEQAKKKALSEGELKTYLAMREEFARSLVQAQALQVPDGKNYRQHFRVAQMYAAEINSLYKTMTKEVSRSGFAVMLPAEIKVGQKVTFSITLARGVDPVTGEARVVSSTKQSQWRTSLAIDSMSEANTERLEAALFDAVLSRFK